MFAVKLATIVPCVCLYSARYLTALNAGTKKRPSKVSEQIHTHIVYGGKSSPKHNSNTVKSQNSVHTHSTYIYIYNNQIYTYGIESVGNQ